MHTIVPILNHKTGMQVILCEFKNMLKDAFKKKLHFLALS